MMAARFFSLLLIICVCYAPNATADQTADDQPKTEAKPSDSQFHPTFVPVVRPTSNMPGSKGSKGMTVFGTALSSIGGGIYVEGIASFLADRAEKELTSWVTDVLLHKVCNLKDKTGNKKVGEKWFPDTCKLVGDAKGIGFQINGPLLVSAMRHDLENLPWLILEHVLDGKVKDVRPAGEALAGFVRQALRGDPPLGLLAGLGTLEDLRTSCTQNEVSLACMLAVVGSVTIHLGGVWTEVTLADRPAWLDDTKAMRDKIGIANLDLLNNDLASFCTGSNNLCNGIKATIGARNLTNDKERKEFARFTDFVRSIASLHSRLLEIIDSKQAEVGKQRPLIASQVLNMVADVIEAGAGMAPSLSAEQQKYIQSFTAALRGFSDIIVGDYSKGIGEVLQVIAKVWDSKDSIPVEVRRMLSLATDLAQANTRDDVEAALDAAAEPIGGWRLKREQIFTLSISGFVGGQAGGESNCGNAPCAAGDEAGWAAGLFAAVGLDMAWNIGKNWTFGPFISVLDLGQLTWVRLSDRVQGDRELDTTPEVGFAQVFSPGLYLRFGVGNTPFTFGLGASYAPALRGYEWKSETPEPADQADGEQWALRFGVFLAVDVTIINLW